MENLEKFYKQEKDKHERFVEYNQNRNKSLYSAEELTQFDSYIRNSSDWLRKIERLINKTYIFEEND